MHVVLLFSFRSVREAAGRIGAQSRPPPRLHVRPGGSTSPTSLPAIGEGAGPMTDRRPLCCDQQRRAQDQLDLFATSRGISFTDLARDARALHLASRLLERTLDDIEAVGVEALHALDLGPLVHGPRTKADLHQGDLLQEPAAGGASPSGWP